MLAYYYVNINHKWVGLQQEKNKKIIRDLRNIWGKLTEINLQICLI